MITIEGKHRQHEIALVQRGNLKRALDLTTFNRNTASPVKASPSKATFKISAHEFFHRTSRMTEHDTMIKIIQLTRHTCTRQHLHKIDIPHPRATPNLSSPLQQHQQRSRIRTLISTHIQNTSYDFQCSNQTTTLHICITILFLTLSNPIPRPR